MLPPAVAFAHKNTVIVDIITQETFALQRGRARAGAECGQSAEHTDRHGAASTGPRPRGRGMFRGTAYLHAPLLRFNGAAPARARNEGYGLAMMRRT